ncbi:aminotransferase class IV [Clostridium sp. CS001]|uniref:aminotransferase class IV n=1 Tax=Clostridium sp. CS001 TaxID=2880648 RepID=UPI001CF22C90|nr:aminotransferase class IV [Clostridium sp. CS001]MCB2288824.1 aminotransferase class IV [Clostridium sp. CS001]
MDKCMNTYFLYENEIKLCEEFKDYYREDGKSLYEVIRIDDGIPVFLMEHIERLYNSAEIMKYNISITTDEIINRILKLISENNVKEGNLKLVINYSLDSGNKEGSKNNNIKKRFLAYFLPHSYPSKEEYAQGVKTIIYHGERSNPNAKVINSVFREKVNALISSKDAYEAILVNDAGFITEGSRSNIFMVIGSTVVTSKLEDVLPGITRQFIIKACKSLNVEFEERNIHEKDLEALTGLFISGTSPKVLPIKSVDDLLFNSSRNTIINLIMKELQVEINKNKQSFVKYMKN